MSTGPLTPGVRVIVRVKAAPNTAYVGILVELPQLGIVILEDAYVFRDIDHLSTPIPASLGLVVLEGWYEISHRADLTSRD